MSENTRVMDCAPEHVFDILADGWSYATWVVGAARIRAVDKQWPAPGSKIHHSVGAWPLMIHDNSEVESVDAPHQILLTVRAWPTGEGRVKIAVSPEGSRTRVTMTEDATGGPAVMLFKPARQLMLRFRNAESLRRLAYLAQGRARSNED